MRTARAEYGVEPAFALQVVVVSGILQWKYEIQVPLDGSGVARARANAAPDEIQAPVDSGSDIRR